MAVLMAQGKVKWFNSIKGYGFITEEKTEKDINHYNYQNR